MYFVFVLFSAFVKYKFSMLVNIVDFQILIKLLNQLLRLRFLNYLLQPEIQRKIMVNDQTV